MKTVKEVSEITGVSIRALRYYDEIGLLKPTEVTAAGYRLYDRAALAKLREILFYRELDIPIADIQKMMDASGYDRKKVLAEQKGMLEKERSRINGLIELITDRMEDADTMNFEMFSEKEVDQIIDHALRQQSPESMEVILANYGNIENLREQVKESFQDEKVVSNLIKIHGSKDKALKASLAADGDHGRTENFRKKTEEIYRAFAEAMRAEDEAYAMELTARLAEASKEMFALDNARALLLNMAKEYRKRGLLCAATDKQYGEGVTEYIGRMIQKYYGV